MPNDIAVISAIDKINASPELLRAVGATSFIFQPYENDVQFDRLKHVRQFSGTQKLVQSIMRILLTRLGDSYEDSKWGSDINNEIGSKIANENYAIIRESIIAALTHYNQINQDNPDSDEVISTIDLIQVVADTTDPRIIRVVVGVTTESGVSVQVVVPQVNN
jgi:phage baseplate assembly protein W